MDFYGLIKSIHIISVISWMAGLLYLPRLFVYHSGCDKCDKMSFTFKIMERKLYRYIMIPALFGVWISGIVMIYVGGFGESVWLIVKICDIINDIQWNFGRSVKEV